MVEIAPQTHMGAVELSVSDLDRSLEYWQRVVGLRVLGRDNGTASLGADTELVRFVEEPGSKPADGHTGLYHVALLVPDRPSLARWLAHAAREQVRIEGLSDHDVSEAIYLRDPDRHGIEIYADRPRALWEGHVRERMTTLPLDVENLLAELADPATEPFEGLPDGTAVGHVHLRVADVDSTVAFYRDVLGMGLMAQLGAGCRIPERRRLPPSRRRQHVGVARRSAGGPRLRDAAARDDRAAGCGRARPGRGAGGRFRAGAGATRRRRPRPRPVREPAAPHRLIDRLYL